MFSNDAQDILVGSSQPSNKRQYSLPNTNLTNVDKKKKFLPEKVKCPEGMHREVFNLFVHQGKDNNQEKIESLISSKTKKGFTIAKAQIGKKAVRKWNWRAFMNEGRSDCLQLSHWEREDKAQLPYQFAKFNKKLDIPKFTNEEYNEYLQDPRSRWTREETLHLLDLCQQFDLRWPIIEDRFDKDRFKNKKSMEDMKERYYWVENMVAGTNSASRTEPVAYDAEHERRRKEQLNKLWGRTEEQMKEEEELSEAVKKIEARRKDRERKAHDLQKLINAADRISISPDSTASNTPSLIGTARGHRRSLKKLGTNNTYAGQLMSAMDSQIRWPEFKTPGPHLRSQEMKLPSNTGQKKLNNIGLIVTARKLVSIGLEYPHAFEDIVKLYNDYRSNIVLLQELKSAVHTTELELDQIASRLPEDRVATMPIEPRLRVSSIFYDELERGTIVVAKSAEGKGKGKQKGNVPVTAREITKMIEINPPSVTTTRKRRSNLDSQGRRSTFGVGESAQD